MSEFYDEMEDMVQEVLDVSELGQDGIILIVKVKTPAANSWDKPTTVPASYPLRGAAKRVNQRYENGALIVATGDLVTFAPPEIEPKVEHFISINGNERAITSLKRIPSAGTVVAWQAFCEL